MPPKKKVTDVQVVEQPTAVMGVDFKGALSSLDDARKFIQGVAEQFTGEDYVSMIDTKRRAPDGRMENVKKPYPKVEWWSTIGASIGVFAKEVSSVRLDREDEIAYEAVVEISKNGHVVTSASAVCSSKESFRGGKDEHAIKSMATTRATSKAFRTGFSWLAAMAGLQSTPEEEMTEVAEKRQRTVMDAGSALKKMSEEKRNGGTSQEYDKEITAAGSLEELADIQKRIMDAKLIKESRMFLIKMLANRRKELKK